MPKPTPRQLFEHALLLDASERAALLGYLLDKHEGDIRDGIKAHILVEGVTYNGTFDRHGCHASREQKVIFRECTFERVDGYSEVSASFINCSFENCDLVDASFDCVLFVDVSFDGCIFRDETVNFCIFVECVFSNCSFLPDSTGGECTFEGTRWYGCEASGCIGLDGVVPSRP
jgi:uncharacterized protein YjbI with pentapeptide repeats